MPPLPAPTTQPLSSRLTSLSDANKGVQALIQRLAKLDFQPGSQPLDPAADEGDVRLELSAEIHETLKGVEEDLELLRQEVEDFLARDSKRGGANSGRDAERNRVAVVLARLTEDLKGSRAQFRKAQLTAKHNADRAKVKERELLFSSLQSGSSTPTSTYRNRSKNNQQLNEAEIVQQASGDVTAALRRTHQLMQSELSRSRFAQDTLEQSTAALADLGERYTDLNSLLVNSRQLVGTLLKSQKSDTWYLETTLYVLGATLIWLIFRRWLYGPITWFIIWPLKLFFRIFFAITGFSAASSSSSSSVVASSDTATRPTLVVKPSAEGDIPKRVPGAADDEQGRHYMRVGGGGRGYMQDQPPGQNDNSYARYVEKMAEKAKQEQKEQEQGKQQDSRDESKEPVIRGDGTVLEERGDRPANPKKRVFDTEVEQAKEAAGEMANEEVVGEKKNLRKRDEL